MYIECVKFKSIWNNNFVGGSMEAWWQYSNLFEYFKLSSTRNL